MYLYFDNFLRKNRHAANTTYGIHGRQLSAFRQCVQAVQA